MSSPRQEREVLTVSGDWPRSRGHTTIMVFKRKRRVQNRDRVLISASNVGVEAKRDSSRIRIAQERRLTPCFERICLVENTISLNGYSDLFSLAFRGRDGNDHQVLMSRTRLLLWKFG